MISAPTADMALREAAKRVKSMCGSWAVYADANGFGFTAEPLNWAGWNVASAPCQGFWRVDTNGCITAHLGGDAMHVGRWNRDTLKISLDGPAQAKRRAKVLEA